MKSASPHRFHAMASVTSYIKTPIGCLKAVETQKKLSTLDRVDAPSSLSLNTPKTDLLCRLETVLDDYFSGKLKHVPIPLAPTGTPFQKRVWSQLSKVPFGNTINYTQLAESIGAPHAVRAVGSALAKNPILILIPCHRVI